MPLDHIHHDFILLRNWPEVSSFMLHLIWADLLKYHLKHLLCRLFFNIANSVDHNKAVIPWDKSSLYSTSSLCMCVFILCWLYIQITCMFDLRLNSGFVLFTDFICSVILWTVKLQHLGSNFTIVFAWLKYWLCKLVSPKIYGHV